MYQNRYRSNNHSNYRSSLRYNKDSHCQTNLPTLTWIVRRLCCFCVKCLRSYMHIVIQALFRKHLYDIQCFVRECNRCVGLRCVCVVLQPGFATHDRNVGDDVTADGMFSLDLTATGRAHNTNTPNRHHLTSHHIILHLAVAFLFKATYIMYLLQGKSSKSNLASHGGHDCGSL